MFVQADAAAGVDAVPHNARQQAAVQAPHALSLQNVDSHANSAALLRPAHGSGGSSLPKAALAVHGRRLYERLEIFVSCTAAATTCARTEGRGRRARGGGAGERETRREKRGGERGRASRLCACLKASYHLALQLEAGLGGIDRVRHALRHRGRCGACTHALTHRRGPPTAVRPEAAGPSAHPGACPKHAPTHARTHACTHARMHACMHTYTGVCQPAAVSANFSGVTALLCPSLTVILPIADSLSSRRCVQILMPNGSHARDAAYGGAARIQRLQRRERLGRAVCRQPARCHPPSLFFSAAFHAKPSPGAQPP